MVPSFLSFPPTLGSLSPISFFLLHNTPLPVVSLSSVSVNECWWVLAIISFPAMHFIVIGSITARWKEQMIFSCMFQLLISLVIYQGIFFLITFCYCTGHRSASTFPSQKGETYFLLYLFYQDPFLSFHSWTLSCHILVSGIKKQMSSNTHDCNCYKVYLLLKQQWP